MQYTERPTPGQPIPIVDNTTVRKGSGLTPLLHWLKQLSGTEAKELFTELDRTPDVVWVLLDALVDSHPELAGDTEF